MADIDGDIKEDIHYHCQLYFNLDESNDYKNDINKGLDNLETIRKKIIKDLDIKDFPRLMGKIYIKNRDAIKKQNNQYRLEIRHKVQCLKGKNILGECKYLQGTMLEFNKVPFLHFKYIGFIEGEYEFTVPEKYPICILGDFQPLVTNDERTLNDLAELLTITGTEYEEPQNLTIDKFEYEKFENADGDEVKELKNLGEHTFTNIQFYTGTVKINVTGDFGYVSFYVHDRGYMGGQKRFKYSDICLTV